MKGSVVTLGWTSKMPTATAAAAEKTIKWSEILNHDISPVVAKLVDTPLVELEGLLFQLCSR